jgi:hypothetical protein
MWEQSLEHTVKMQCKSYNSVSVHAAFFLSVDYIRTFTWDKKLEMVVKSTGILGGQGEKVLVCLFFNTVLIYSLNI